MAGLPNPGRAASLSWHAAAADWATALGGGEHAERVDRVAAAAAVDVVDDRVPPRARQDRPRVLHPLA